jgi:hypothetical protein
MQSGGGVMNVFGNKINWKFREIKKPPELTGDSVYLFLTRILPPL